MNCSFRPWLLWTPRVLCILYAVFISIFALDSFSPDRRLAENLLALAMHLIPTAIVLVVLALAWHWAWVGAVVYAGLGVLYLVMPGGRRLHWSAYAMIAGPLFLTGALFLLSWWYRKKIIAGPVRSH